MTAASLLIARYLRAAALGIYSAGIVFLALIMLASKMGATNFLAREIARGKLKFTQSCSTGEQQRSREYGENCSRFID